MFILSSFQMSTDLLFYSFGVFWIKRWGYMWKSVGHWGSYDLNQGYHLQILKNTHNNIISWFYDHALILLLFISWSTELIFYSFKIIFSKSWGSLGWNNGHWYSYGIKHGNSLQSIPTYWQQPTILIWTYSFLHLLIISNSTDFIFDSFQFFLSKRWGYLSEIVGHWGVFNQNQWNPL